jgi:recombinational DNA repair protein RecT
MEKTKDLTTTQSLDLAPIQSQFKEISKQYLAARGANNPEFEAVFMKTGTDLLFSQNDEMMEKVLKTKINSLLNAVFQAAEIGASFSKKEIYFIPYEINKTEFVNGTKRTTKTGEYTATLITDVNFQKQQILKLENCKRFFTAEVHNGVEIIHDLVTGNCIFEGKNDVTKPTIGYYARFEATSGEVYDLFMSNAEIKERASFSPQYKEDKFASAEKNIHYEKVVVRNILKIIPKISETLKTTISMEFSEYELVDEVKEPNRLEAAKKEIAEKSKGAPKVEDVKTVDVAPEPIQSNEAAFLGEGKGNEEIVKEQKTSTDFF